MARLDPVQEGTAFYVDGVHVGDSDAPMLCANPVCAVGSPPSPHTLQPIGPPLCCSSPLADGCSAAGTTGNLRPSTQGAPKTLASTAALADLRLFGNTEDGAVADSHTLTADERAKLLAMVDPDLRGTGAGCAHNIAQQTRNTFR